MSFHNKIVIVTGAAKGIGRGVATLYAEKGAKVVLADVDQMGGEQTASEITAKGGQALFVLTDVRKEADIINLMKSTHDTYGQIHILINNAGKGLFKSPYEVTLEEWDDVINTNLRSVFLASREAGKYMRENEDGGAIVNLASTRAMMSEANSESYAATKGGMELSPLLMHSQPP